MSQLQSFALGMSPQLLICAGFVPLPSGSFVMTQRPSLDKTNVGLPVCFEAPQSPWDDQLPGDPGPVVDGS